MPIDHPECSAKRPKSRAACGLAWLAGMAVASVLGMVPMPVAATDASFDRTLHQIGGFCARGPALACAEQFFALTDADDDGRLDTLEIENLKARLQDWTAANGEALNPTDLKALQVGFLLVDTIGVERGMLLYDDDGDGALSFAEATADLHLDHRPLPRLVQERELVNWPSLRRRFGATAMLFDYLDIR